MALLDVLTRPPQVPRAVDRPRLRELLSTGPEPACLLVAPPGSGKTVAAAQLLAHATREPPDPGQGRPPEGDQRPRFRGAGSGDGGAGLRVGWCRFAPGAAGGDDLVRLVAASLGRGPVDAGVTPLERTAALLDVIGDGPVLLVLDDYELARPEECDAVLAEVLALVPPDCRIVVAGATRPAGLLGRASVGQARVVGADALAFTEGEVATLLASLGRDPGLASDLHSASAGWATAVAVLAEGPSRPGDVDPPGAAAWAPGDRGLSGAVEEMLDRAGLGRVDDGRPGDASRELLAAVSLVPAIGPAELAALGLAPDVLAELASTSALLRPVGDRWALLDLVRRPLQRRLGPERLRAAAGRLAPVLAGSDPVGAADVLMAVGDPAGAADVLARRASAVPPAAALPLLYRMPAEVRRRLPPLLSGARATVEMDSALAGAEQRLASARDERERREAQVAVGTILLHRGQLASAAATLEPVVRATAAPAGAALGPEAVATGRVPVASAHPGPLTAAARGWLALARFWAGDLEGAAALAASALDAQDDPAGDPGEPGDADPPPGVGQVPPVADMAATVGPVARPGAGSGGGPRPGVGQVPPVADMAATVGPVARPEAGSGGGPRPGVGQVPPVADMAATVGPVARPGAGRDLDPLPSGAALVWWVAGEVGLARGDDALVARAVEGLRRRGWRSAEQAVVAQQALAAGDAARAATAAATGYRAAAVGGGLDLLIAAPPHAWCLARAGRWDEAAAVADELRRRLGKVDTCARLQADLVDQARAVHRGDILAETRAARAVAATRRLGYAPVEASARRWLPLAPPPGHLDAGRTGVAGGAAGSAGPGLDPADVGAGAPGPAPGPGAPTTGRPGSGRPVTLGAGPGLGIGVLGPVRIWVDGRAVPDGGWRSRKAREVLLVLALAGEAGRSRDEVIEAVWPERDPVKGRTLLRTALSEVRQVLEPQRPPGEPSRFVSTRGDRVTVQARTDLAEAERLHARARTRDRARGRDRGRDRTEPPPEAGAGAGAEGGDPDATALLHTAWALFRGPFAADEPYTASLDEARRTAERLQLDVADALVTAATTITSTGHGDAAAPARPVDRTDPVGSRPAPVGAEAVVAAAAHILRTEPWRTDLVDQVVAACRAAGAEVQARRAERLLRPAPPE